MPEEDVRGTGEAGGKRSTEQIRQDIAKEEETISQIVGQIGERIEEKLDWRGYVKASPYWALGAAAGLGYLASTVFIPRKTPMERIMNSLAGEVRDSLDSLRAGPGLMKMTLLGIATKAAAGWVKNATSTAVAAVGAAPRPQTGGGSPANPRAEINSNV